MLAEKQEIRRDWDPCGNPQIVERIVSVTEQLFDAETRALIDALVYPVAPPQRCPYCNVELGRWRYERGSRTFCSWTCADDFIEGAGGMHIAVCADCEFPEEECICDQLDRLESEIEDIEGEIDELETKKSRVECKIHELEAGRTAAFERVRNR